MLEAAVKHALFLGSATSLFDKVFGPVLHADRAALARGVDEHRPRSTSPRRSSATRCATSCA
jgi:hypothetical protein